MKNKIRKFLTELKDDNPYLRLMWLEMLARRSRKERATLSDIDCINKIYKGYCGHLPNLDAPTVFSEKMQWMKLHYRNHLMPIVGDKYTVRAYLEEKGYGYLLNDIIAVYDDVNDIDIDALPSQFVMKASHSSGWNLVVKDKKKISWPIWMRHFKYWLTHDIEWNGREWHYGEMKPRIVCEKYLEDKSGGLMDYKFFCFNGEPRFLQINVDRFLPTATQNYYDLDFNLLPFGKTHKHNPNAKVEKPAHFDEMIKVARELCKPFPYVRVDFYEANDRLYFGEFTFFPASGMPDFIPAEWDEKVGAMLVLPEANL